ncbi:EsaB/YukD family protein [Streptomyces sp. NPDC059489]|uniref:EsaB/YukD family protein n=1 Tax=Streptomyces sp. NPDC059489 TaxID=3346849 RepID=UPI0036840E3F
MDEHCRITVVGERRQVDLAVPSHAPIVSYVNALARLCHEQDDDVMPVAWSLADTVGSPFAPERSLAELGVIDGQVLYLRDAAADELDEPVVYDVAERVAELSEGVLDRLWDVRTRVTTVTAIGLCWLVAVLTVLTARGRFGTGVLTDLTVSAGLLLPALAWVAGERRWTMPWWLRQAIALTSVPLLALAGRTLGAAGWPGGPVGLLNQGGVTAEALLVGALIGAVLAYVAAFGVITCVVLATTLTAALLGAVLALLGANGAQAASVVAAVGFVLVTCAAPASSGLVAFVYRRSEARRIPAEENHDEDRVAEATRVARTVLVGWTGVLAVVLATALVVAAASGSSYGAGLVACLGVALLLRAGEANLVAEVVLIAGAGTTGLCVWLVIGSGHFGLSGWQAPAVACVAPVAMIGYGLRHLTSRPERPLQSRPRWLTGVASMMGGFAVALAVGTFGMFDWFLDLGRGL